MYLFKGTFGSLTDFAIANSKKEALTNLWKHQGMNGFPFELEKISEIDGYKIVPMRKEGK